MFRNMKRKFDSLVPAVVPNFLRNRRKRRRRRTHPPPERSFRKPVVVIDDSEDEQEQSRKPVFKKPNLAIDDSDSEDEQEQARKPVFKKPNLAIDDSDSEDEQEQARKPVFKKPNLARKYNGAIVFREPESGKNLFLESLKHNADDNRTREEVLKYERSLKKPMKEVVVLYDSDDSDDDEVSPISEEVKEVWLSNGAVIREPGPSKNPFIVLPENMMVSVGA